MKMFRLRILFVFIVSLFLTDCKDPIEIDLYGEIGGTVTDADTNEPLRGALVTLSPVNMSTLTGSDGQYSFKRLDPQQYKVQVSLEGYLTDSKNLSVIAGEITYGDLSLESIQPILEVSSLNVDFGESATQIPVTITNSGKGELQWSVVESISWASVDQTSGTTTNQTSVIVISVDRSALSSGTYIETIAITSNGGAKTLNVSCTKADLTTAKITTGSATNITQTSADISLTLTSIGAGQVTAYGHCYSTSILPTVSDFKTNLGPASGPVTAASTLSGLEMNTTYFVRAYATNAYGTGYSTQVSFVTRPPESAPSVSTGVISNIVSTGASCSAEITSLGSEDVTQYGHCWSQQHQPTTDDQSSQLGSTSTVLSYTTDMSGMESNTTYYVRAYATNAVGTTYGNEVSFTTTKDSNLPDVTTNTVGSVTSSSAVVSGNVVSEGNSSVTIKGICYSTSPSPTTSDSYVPGGSGGGSFSCTLTSLVPGTTYYARAFAQNGAGIAYGDEKEFTTNQISAVMPISPINGAVVNGYFFMKWSCSPETSKYELQVAPSPDFPDPVYTWTNSTGGYYLSKTRTYSLVLESNCWGDGTTGTSIHGGTIEEQTFYWRIRPVVGSTGGPWSNVASFTFVF